MRVAIQGIKGSYSEEAAVEMLGREVALIECADFAAAFDTVGTARAECAVVPLRNSIVGEIGRVARLLEKGGVEVERELTLEINHVLAGTVDSHLGSVTTVLSHPEALKQCSDFLSLYTQIDQVVAADTASSISLIAARGDKRSAAIGSPRAALMYGAKILRGGIANTRDNKTTFGLIVRKD